MRLYVLRHDINVLTLLYTTSSRTSDARILIYSSANVWFLGPRRSHFCEYIRVSSAAPRHEACNQASRNQPSRQLSLRNAGNTVRSRCLPEKRQGRKVSAARIDLHASSNYAALPLILFVFFVAIDIGSIRSSMTAVGLCCSGQTTGSASSSSTPAIIHLRETNGIGRAERGGSIDNVYAVTNTKNESSPS